MKRYRKAAAMFTAVLLLTSSAPLISQTSVYADDNSFKSHSRWAFSFPYDKADPSEWEYTVLDGIKGVTDEKCIELKRYISDNTTVVIPSEIDGLPVVSLAKDLFSDHPYISTASVYLPDSVKKADPYFFPEMGSYLIHTETGDCYLYVSPGYAANSYMTLISCNDRENIDIPDNILGIPVTSVSAYLLEQCSKVVSMTLPDSIDTMYADSFGENSSLKKLKIPKDIRIIPSRMFSGLTSLEELILPDDIIGIPADALPEKPLFDYPADKVFDNLSTVSDSKEGITVYDEKNNLCYRIADTFIGPVAYLIYAPELEGPHPSEYSGYPVEEFLYPFPPKGCHVFTVGPNTTTIDFGYDFDPHYIDILNIKSSSISITSPGFIGSGVKTLDFPEKTHLGGSVFSGCTALESVNFHGNAPTITLEFAAFMNDTNLTELTFPESVAFLIIENDVFSHIGLKELILPEGDVRLAEDAFGNCQELKNLVIGNNAEIGKKAFNNCDALTDITFRGNAKLDSKSFYCCDNIDNINVNTDSVINCDGFNYCRSLSKINGKPFIDSSENIDKDNLKFIERNFNASEENGIVNSYVSYRVKNIVSDTVTADMSDMEKVKALHDVLCDMVDYDSKNEDDPKNHVDVSVFLNDKSVCDGYARAMNLMLHEAGIESCYVYNDDHAWVIANIGGHYFHVDPTWDDVGTIIYDWFMKADDQISGDHDHSTWELRKPSSLHDFQTEHLPECTDHMGDVNGDSIVDARDATAILTGYARLSVDADSDLDPVLADYNFSGRIDAADASMVLTDYAKSSAE